LAGAARGSAIGRQVRRQDPHERGLACAVRSEQRQHLALLGAQVDTLKRPRVAELLGDGVNLDHLGLLRHIG
jgi:hypothetical protein